MSQKTFRYIIRGRVQGVFFRATTCQVANRIGITGWVRNCADGSVEITASGNELQLDQLLSWLPHGVPSARVDSLSTESIATETFSNFSVLQTTEVC